MQKKVIKICIYAKKVVLLQAEWCKLVTRKLKVDSK